MRYALLDRGDELSASLAAKFHHLAAAHGMIHDDHTPELVLSIGGDGTLLQAFHTFKERLDEVAFIGVHTGHLGFYADWKADELEQLIEMMASHKPRYVHYPLLKIELEWQVSPLSPDSLSTPGTYLALNEFTIKGVDGTLVAQININDELFEMFRGDGIVISTPTGSTAYNKSLGGAVLHPSIPSLQIAEIASINNRVFRTLGSSVILPAHHHTDILPREDQRLMLVMDHLTLDAQRVRAIRCSVADRRVCFARYRPFPFWNRVRSAFLGYEVH